MSLTSIPTNFMDRTLLWERRTLTQNDIGDPVEAWATINSALKCTLQPVSIKELKDLPQGKEYPITDKAYCEYTEDEIAHGDRMTDSLDGRTYFVVSVQRFKSARVDVTTGQHIKLYLSCSQATKS